MRCGFLCPHDPNQILAHMTPIKSCRGCQCNQDSASISKPYCSPLVMPNPFRKQFLNNYDTFVCFAAFPEKFLPPPLSWFEKLSHLREQKGRLRKFRRDPILLPLPLFSCLFWLMDSISGGWVGSCTVLIAVCPICHPLQVHWEPNSFLHLWEYSSFNKMPFI